jgi:hypothetical protein
MFQRIGSRLIEIASTAAGKSGGDVIKLFTFFTDATADPWQVFPT